MSVDGSVDNSLISVIIPVYRVEATLDRCVSSVAGQTYHNLEIILVDDGSSDACPGMCDAWAQRDSRIRVIHQQNQGLSAARNTGLDHMHGEYVAFVDSDDYVEPDYIKLLLTAMRQHHADLTICAILREQPDGEVLPDRHYDALTDGDEEVWDAHRCLAMRDQRQVPLTVAWNKLYASRLWHDTRFPVGKLHEDEFVTYRIIAQCTRVVLLPRKLYHYVDMPHSIMNAGFSIRNLDRLEAKVERIGFYANRGYPSDVMMTAVDALLWELRYDCGHIDAGDVAVQQRFASLTRKAWKAVRAVPEALERQQRLRVTLYGMAPILTVRVFAVVRGVYRKLRRRS